MDFNCFQVTNSGCAYNGFVDDGSGQLTCNLVSEIGANISVDWCLEIACLQSVNVISRNEGSNQFCRLFNCTSEQQNELSSTVSNNPGDQTTYYIASYPISGS